ncbi:MAG: DUF120 domain-containing protein [Candidatus Micrarchaeota archaeon]
MGINYPLVFALIRAGSHERHVRLPTAELASRLGVSQQTSSRWLILAEKEGWVERSLSGVKLSQKTLSELKILCDSLHASLEARKKITIKGQVMPGMRDGRYYVPLPDYSRQFQQKLGLFPYPGTLNIRIDNIEAKLILADRVGIMISGFPHEGRMLGEIKCFPCIVQKRVKGFVILPSRSHYGLDIIEVISKFNLRKKLGLKDGDSVEISISLE